MTTNWVESKCLVGGSIPSTTRIKIVLRRTRSVPSFFFTKFVEFFSRQNFFTKEDFFGKVYQPKAAESHFIVPVCWTKD